MSSIKGISLKNVKLTAGMEGRGFVATLVMDGRKVGEVADYANGSPFFEYSDVSESDFVELNRRLAEYKKDIKKDSIYFTLEFLIHKVFGLMDREKEFKKALKKDKILVEVIKDKLSDFYLIDSKFASDKDSIIKEFKEEIKCDEVIVYSDLSSFEVV